MKHVNPFTKPAPADRAFIERRKILFDMENWYTRMLEKCGKMVAEPEGALSFDGLGEQLYELKRHRDAASHVGKATKKGGI